MKSETLYRAMNSIDDEIIYRNGKINKVGSTKKHNRNTLYRMIASVAAAAVFFTGINVLKPWERFGQSTGSENGSGIEVADNTTITTSPIEETKNVFVITANAAEPVPDVQTGSISSGDVMGISSSSAGYGSSSFLTERFTISGQNIKKVRIATDKCNIYTSVPVYSGNPDFEKAQNFEYTDIDDYYPIYVGEPEEGGYIDYYEHLQIVGPSFEGDYNDKMYFGMSVPEELLNTGDDLKQGYYDDVDHVNGAIITITVTFNDGSTEEHHYRLETGKIYVPVNAEGCYEWDNLTRFLTPEESAVETPYTYGYLMEKVD